MTALAEPNAAITIENPLTAAHLPRYTPWVTLLCTFVVAGIAFGIIAASAGSMFNIAGAVVVGLVMYLVTIWLISRRVEGRRRAVDRVMTGLVATAFIIALLPLISVAFTTIVNGLPRFDLKFFSQSMRNVVGAGGGAIHAIDGTLLITLAATVISVPIGLLTAIYLVEYGKGPLKRGITFFVDVMTGIPSIVAGLFAFALFSLITGSAGIRFGIGAAVALSVLMIPVVVRSSEEMLKLVPNELREASYALGVPKWLTIVKIVLPTSVAGIVTGVMLAIARVIGETAPLLIIAGFTTSMNTNLFNDRMMTLPVFVFDQYMNQGRDTQAYIDRAWAGALTLILIVALLNIIARVIAKYFSPKTGR